MMSNDTTKSMHRFWPLGLAAMLLSGCLLPQPDTPPLPPFTEAHSARAGAAAPNDKTAPAAAPTADKAGANEGLVSENAGGLISNNAGGLISNNPGGLVSNDAQRTEAGSATMAPTMSAPVAPELKLDATLKGQIKGLPATFIVPLPPFPDVPHPGGRPVGADGTFSVPVYPGVYTFQITVGGKLYHLETPVTVRSGETRTLTITLQENPPKATLTEEAPLTVTSPSPSPSPSPTK